MSLLTVKGLGKSFGGVKAVDGIDFTLNAGELLALIGPNGAGKSTTFNMVNGQLRADAGSILLDMVGMAAQADRPCSVLAYGDVKRVELAIAMANAPKLLLMDEPTAGMAPRERNDLMALTKELVVQRKIAVLFTEHSMDVVFAYADRMIVLARGRLIAEGRPNEVRDLPKVQEVYFGTGKTFEKKDAGAKDAGATSSTEPA